MQDIVIIGAGGFGRETVALINDINRRDGEWNFLGFIDDNATGETVEGYPILGDMNFLLKMEPRPYVSIAIADAKVRERMVKVLKGNGFTLPTLIHPTVAIGPKVTFGEGCIICRGGMYTTNITVGNYVISNLNCTYGHDTVIGDYVSVMSHGSVAGEVNIGKACYFGLHCTVINRINIVDNCTIGAGTVVVRDLTESGTYVGVPAKIIHK